MNTATKTSDRKFIFDKVKNLFNPKLEDESELDQLLNSLAKLDLKEDFIKYLKTKGTLDVSGFIENALLQRQKRAEETELMIYLRTPRIPHKPTLFPCFSALFAKRAPPRRTSSGTYDNLKSIYHPQ